MHVVESLTQCKLFVHISQGLPTPERLFERVDNAIHLVCHLSPICENEIVEGLKTQIKFIKVFVELDISFTAITQTPVSEFADP